MLVVVLGGQRVLGALVPVEIRDRLIGNEISGAGADGIFRKGRCGNLTVGGWNHVLAVGKFGLEQRNRDGIHIAIPGQAGSPDVIRNLGQTLGRAVVVCKFRGNKHAREADFLVGGVSVLVAREAE